VGISYPLVASGQSTPCSLWSKCTLVVREAWLPPTSGDPNNLLVGGGARFLKLHHRYQPDRCPGLEKNLGFFGKSFQVFLDFSVQIKPDTKFRPRKNILYTILSVKLLYVNYNKTHKSQLKYEIKMVCINFDQKIKKT